MRIPVPRHQLQWPTSRRSLCQDHRGWADQLGPHPHLGMRVQRRVHHTSAGTGLLQQIPSNGHEHLSPSALCWPPVARGPSHPRRHQNTRPHISPTRNLAQEQSHLLSLLRNIRRGTAPFDSRQTRPASLHQPNWLVWRGRPTVPPRMTRPQVTRNMTDHKVSRVLSCNHSPWQMHIPLPQP